MQIEDFGLTHIITVTIATLSALWMFLTKFFHLSSKVEVIIKDLADTDLRVTKVEDKITRTLERLEDKLDNHILKIYTDGKN